MLRVPYDTDEIIEFVFGPQRFLTGVISADRPEEVCWSMRLNCREARFRNLAAKSAERLAEQKEYAEFLTSCDCFVDISSLSIPVNSWRELMGKQVVVPDQEDVHPIMPDLDAVFYYDSQHFAMRNNRIAFGSRKGCIFQLQWKFKAEESPDDGIDGIELRTTVAMRDFAVYLDPNQTGAREMAIQLASRFAEANDLAIDAVESPNQYCLVVPLRPNVS